MRLKPLALAVLLVLPLPIEAAEIDRAKEYAGCMAEARKNPKEGFERAVAWKGLGGGAPAEHCACVALIGLGQYTDAAKRLEILAQNVRQDAPFKAKVLGQAGQAWLLAGDPARAEATAATALKLMPDSADLYVDRANARAARKDYKSALADLDQALRQAPDWPDALAFRASARRFLDDNAGALADANRALAIDPGHPEALLERGILKRMNGDDAGARADWMTLLRTAPESDTAAAARANLEKMDVKSGK